MTDHGDYFGRSTREWVFMPDGSVVKPEGADTTHTSNSDQVPAADGLSPAAPPRPVSPNGPVRTAPGRWFWIVWGVGIVILGLVFYARHQNGAAITSALLVAGLIWLCFPIPRLAFRTSLAHMLLPACFLLMCGIGLAQYHHTDTQGAQQTTDDTTDPGEGLSPASLEGQAAAERLHASGITNNTFSCGQQYDYDSKTAAIGLPAAAADALPNGAPDTLDYPEAEDYMLACENATF